MRSKLAERTVLANSMGFRVNRSGVVIAPDGRAISATSTPQGYLKFTLRASRDDRSRVVFVHQLMALQKFGMKALEPGVQVRHLNNVRTDNRRANIAIGSSSANQLDIPVEFRRARAKNASLAAVKKTRRFTARQIKDIRSSKKSIRTLAKELRVSRSTLSYILNGITYTDIGS